MNLITKISTKKGLVALAITCFASLLSFGIPSISHAAAVVGFNPGNIMDNLVMTSSGTMNVSQIQTFLNSKVPVCDTNHAGFYGSSGTWYGPPFTCLKDYTENSLTAAQIIYNAAHTYSINPQVLLVLLQKEEALITDTWPASYQYKSATGYGCPDSTPGVCNSSYYGFTNQVNSAAKLFHSVIISSPTWYSPYVLGNNSIKWSPNDSCGSSTVYIQNQATAALYDYTPYRPNQASLNAGYGSGDSCSSYGNRNFYLYFTDWFGSTTSACLGNEPALLQVQRLYNPTTNEHFYASLQCEVNTLTKGSFSLVGSAFNTTGATETWAVPVYRLYSPGRQLHFWTTSTSESGTLQSIGFRYEGIAFYVLNPSTPNASPVYRMYNPSTQVHLWTTSLAEADNANRNGGFRFEGPAFYGQ